jgi:peptidoglycan hydrolase-like protein with peptidoglycan-binding domain
LIGGGWYYWNAGYWYPAWGYDNSAAYYPYDGPIYVGKSAKPFDQIVADVQTILQEQSLYRGEVDGLVGPLTQEALAAYQTALGLEPTAAVDQPTLEALGMGQET